MASGALWFVLFLLGCGFLALVQVVGPPTVKAISLRLAMLVFVAAGTVGPMGWVGDVLAWCVVQVNHWGDQFGRDALGTGVMWILYAALCLMWSAGFLPSRLIKWDPPDPLAVIGILLPALASSIPGRFGNFFQSLFDAIGESVTDLVASWFGG